MNESNQSKKIYTFSKTDYIIMKFLVPVGLTIMLAGLIIVGCIAGNQPADNEFKGLKAVFLGDSQTGVNTHKDKIWWQWVQEDLGLGDCVNYGMDGSTITNNGENSMSARYANMDSDADLVFVMGGVNDVWFSQPMGTISDTENSTFCGAVRFLCRELRKKYPGKPIIFITPTLENSDKCTHNEGLEVTSFAYAMREICYSEGILCLDAHGSLGINPIIDTSFTTDGLHLNNAGHELLGKWVAKQVRENVVINGK